MVSIRILESENNRRGDLFTRLVTDFFQTLGYDNPRLDNPKAGREIDVEATHRIENRRLVAECKAQAAPVGGAAINKFVGVLDAERKRSAQTETVGYFVSLSGFTGAAIEQEKDAGGNRVELIKGDDVVKELITGNIIVSPELAMERAGGCAALAAAGLKPEGELELCAHRLGWIWAIPFGQNKKVTHFALVHADGAALDDEIAKQVIQSDKTIKGWLHKLTYLPPQSNAGVSSTEIDKARQQYFKYLTAECGDIQLEGMPQDEEVGSRRLKLEDLFVPLDLIPIGSGEDATTPGPTQEGDRKTTGEVLSQYNRLAILAAHPRCSTGSRPPTRPRTGAA